MKRRKFIKTVAAGVSSLAFLTSLHEQSAEQVKQFQIKLQAAKDDSDFWNIVGEEFALSPEIVHLNCGSIGACPKIVTHALVTFAREIEKDPYHHVFGDGINQNLEAVRALAAGFINSATEEVAITRNTTEGMNLIARGLDLERGDEVLTSNHEHAGGMACWQYLAKRFGVHVVCLKMPNPITDPQEVLELVRKSITPRTKVFSFCHVDTITGFVMPIAAIALAAKQSGIFFVCDGAQAPGMLKVDVKQLGVDAYVSSSHKWMLAPKGSGLLFINKSSQPRIKSTELSSGYGVYTASSGTRDVAQILAHGIAIEFQQAIGSQKIEQRIQKLNRYLSKKLRQVKALRCLTSEIETGKSGMVTVAIDPTISSSFDLAQRMRIDSKIYVKAAQSTLTLVPDVAALQEDYNAIRFSTHIFNSEAQIDRAVESLKESLDEK